MLIYCWALGEGPALFGGCKPHFSHCGGWGGTGLPFETTAAKKPGKQNVSIEQGGIPANSNQKKVILPFPQKTEPRIWVGPLSPLIKGELWMERGEFLFHIKGEHISIKNNGKPRGFFRTTGGLGMACNKKKKKKHWGGKSSF